MKKHFTKFLPIALAVMVATTGTSFAASYTNGSSQQQSDMSITVPAYLNIIKTAGKNESSGVTNFSATYDAINLDTAMEADFTVYNNLPGQKIYLRATTGPDATPAIGVVTATASGSGSGTSSELYLAFSNTTSGQQPTADDITNALAPTGTVKKENKNCIAFQLTPKLGVVAGTASADAGETGATADIQADGSNKKIQYTLNNGGYTFNYKLAQVAKTDTFSTHDTKGTYTATLYLTTVATNGL